MRNKIVFIMVALFILSSMALSQEVPQANQVVLVLKIASMDRNFDRYGDPIKIGVTSDAMLKEFQAKQDMTVKGKAFVAEKMNALEDLGKYKIVYVDKNWSSNYAAAAEKATANQTLVFCNDYDYVESGGGAVSFKVVGGKARIVLNRENVKKQGSDFPANFLQITVVVGSVN